MNMVSRILCHCTLAAGVASASSPAYAQQTTDAIAVAVPQSGPYALFGNQFLQGLQASPITAQYDFEIVDTACSRTGGEAVASQIDASIIVGFTCVDALDAAQQTGALAGKTIIVPFAGPLSQAPATDTTNYARTISFGPSPTDETDILAQYVIANWRDKNIAVIDDGTLYGRQIAQDVLAAMTEQNLTPVYTTTFRPQLDNQVGLVRLLQRAGATHVVVGGDRFDAAAIANATAIVDYRLTLAGGTAFGEGVAEGTLPDGTVYVSLPDWTQQNTAQDFIATLDETGNTPEGFTFWGYATGQLMAQWLEQDALNATDIAHRSWPTIFGDLSFNDDAVLTSNLYEIRQVETVQTTAPSSDGTN